MKLTMTNEERSRIEVDAFKHDKPESYFAYRGWGPDHVPGDRWVTTWTGDRLARVTELGQSYRSNMGDLRQSFRAKGINGCTYSGTAYLSSGDYVRMRKVKS